MIVHSARPVTLVGGAHVRPADLDEALSRAPVLVAADGGAGMLWQAGLRPVAVIGDMDSIPPGARAAFGDVLHEVAEQETTDFDKALREIDAPLILALGFTGGRLDHELAALHSLALRPAARCIIVGSETLVFLCPPRITLALDPGMIVSLFPLAEVRVTSTGLLWPTDQLTFSALTRIGTSNSATGPVSLAPDAPRLLVILPRAALAAAAAALGASPGPAARPATLSA